VPADQENPAAEPPRSYAEDIRRLKAAVRALETASRQPRAQPSPTGPVGPAALTALGAVASSLGVLGFLTFVGGAVTVGRLRGIGLSGTTGVAITPRGELLSNGADQLFAPLVVCLLVTATIAGIFAIGLPWSGVRPLTLGVAVGLGMLAFWRQVGNPFHHHESLGIILRDNRTDSFIGATLVTILGAVVASLFWKREQDRSRESDADERPRHPRVRPLIGLTAAIFISGAVWAAFETYAYQEANPKIRPGALVRGPKDAGLAGYYVGKDSDYIYLGIVQDQGPDRLHGGRLTAHLIAVRKNEVTELAIGPVVCRPRADLIAPKMLAELRIIASHASAPTGAVRFIDPKIDDRDPNSPKLCA
jgi:hypothetical protein